MAKPVPNIKLVIEEPASAERAQGWHPACTPLRSMTRRLGSRIGCVAISVAVLAGAPVRLGWAATRSQLPPDDKQATVDSAVRLMEGNSWQTRSEGFYQLFRAELPSGLDGASTRISPTLRTLLRDVPDRAEKVTRTLIDLLRRENAYSRSSQTTEEYSSYHGDLILAVASVEDKRALVPLLEVVESGNLAARGIARLGAAAALRPLLVLTLDSSALKRNAATRALGFLLDPAINQEPLTPQQAADIRTALIRATGDDDHFVRISAIESVSRFSDPQVTRLLQRLADSDPYSTQAESGEVVFPVREAARRALDAGTRRVEAAFRKA